MVSTSRYNSAILVERDGRMVGHYRKIHLPGYKDVQPDHPFQNLEKRYFEVGDLGFGVWPAFGGRVGMCICNDRRWCETYRVMGLQGVELVLLGYNTPIHNPAFPQSDRLAEFQSQLSMQAGAYQNATWVVGVAKAGVEAGVHQIGGTCVIAPTGEVVAKGNDRRGRDRHGLVRPRPRPCVQGVRLRPRRQSAARTLCATHGARGT